MEPELSIEKWNNQSTSLYLTCLQVDSWVWSCSKHSLEEHDAGLEDFILNEDLDHCLCMVSIAPWTECAYSLSDGRISKWPWSLSNK